MPTRNVVLTHHQTAVVEQLVSSGRYQNASEVLRDGLRLIEQREQAHRLERSRDDLEAGRGHLWHRARVLIQGNALRGQAAA